MRRLALFGSGGHAKVLVDLAQKKGVPAVACFDDEKKRWNCPVGNLRVLGGREEYLKWESRAGPAESLCALGDNPARRDLFRWLEKHGAVAQALVHPHACLGGGVTLGVGSVVMAGVVINPDTRVGKNTILNTRCSVDHDCEIGDHCHLGPGSTLCGGVSVGEGALLGAGCVVLPGEKIPPGVIVPAGAVVRKGFASWRRHQPRPSPR